MLFIFLQDVGKWTTNPYKYGGRVIIDLFLVMGMFIGLFVKGC